jgi:crotonobetainyl-CoA:carnitine CoA-transferase CaiB-like acyl-CoA transferase
MKEASMTGLPPGVLSGVRILDMATVVAAPFAASLCADLGAEVLKIELPDGSDTLRGMAPTQGEHALHWKVTNRGKRGISLDVRTPEGKALLLKLLPGFDVLVENFRTGTLDRWGLDLATLHAVNPRLTVLRLTGFGQTGPKARDPGFARIFEAMGGLAHLTGEPEGSPQHINYPMGDMTAGLFGAFSIASALVELRAHPDRPGREIDLSATEVLLRLLETLPVEHERLGVARKRSGARATYTAPSSIFRSGDGHWFTLVAGANAMFRRLCEAMQRPELLQDPRMSEARARTANLDAVNDAVAQWAASLPFAEIAAKLKAVDAPFQKVYDVADVLADEHFKARGAITRLPDPELGSVPAPAAVPRFSGLPQIVHRTGPGIGEHNAEVYGELGLGPADLERLRAGGII